MPTDVICDRVQFLCDKHKINIKNLESVLGFANGSINKWRVSSPSVNKVQKVANYFNVSIDYLLDRTDIEDTISAVINDEDIIRIQRARQKGTSEDRKRMMDIVELAFVDLFSDTEDK